jgi:hypothetical protein
MPKKNPPVLMSVAIHQLRELAVELKKTPTALDIESAARQKKCPSMGTINKLFGGVMAAMKASRLPPQRNQEFTPQELIAQLQDLSRALGRPVTRKDVKKAGRAGTCARLVTFRRVFGNASSAFRQAGVLKNGRFTRAELIAQYTALHKDLGRLPTYDDIHRAAREGKCAGYKTLRRQCGTLQQLRRAAGLTHNSRRKYSEQQLLEQLKRLAAKLGRTPIAIELIAAAREGDCADIATFRSYFGTFNKALKAAGLNTRARSFSRGQLIQILQELAKKLGHRPTVKEVNKASSRGECASAKTFDNYFGNHSAALRAARLDTMPALVARRKPRKARPRYTREQMQDRLRRLGDSLGRPPSQRDVNAASATRDCPSVSALAGRFGTSERRSGLLGSMSPNV